MEVPEKKSQMVSRSDFLQASPCGQLAGKRNQLQRWPENDDSTCVYAEERRRKERRDERAAKKKKKKKRER